MSPHGSHKPAKAKSEPNELYDKLSQTGQDVWDLIGSHGFRPDQNEKKEWIALATQGDDIIGPCESLSALGTAVEQHVKAKAKADSAKKPDKKVKEAADKTNSPVEPGAKLHKIAEDHKGNRYLPGQEPIVDSEIAAAAGKYHAIKIDRCNLTTKEVAAKEELIDICHRKKHLFKADPENTNAKIYKVGDLVVRIQNEVKEKVTTEVVE